MNFSNQLILAVLITSTTSFASDNLIDQQLLLTRNAVSLCRVFEASGSESSISGGGDANIALNLKKLKSLDLGELKGNLNGSHSDWDGIPRVEKRDQLSENKRMSDCVLKAFSMLSQDYLNRLELQDKKQNLLNQEKVISTSNELPREYIYSSNKLRLLPGLYIVRKSYFSLGNDESLDIETSNNHKIRMTNGIKESFDFKDKYYKISFRTNSNGQVVIKLEDDK